MSEEPTRNMPDGRSFEERIFARFDAFDARLDAFNARLDDFNLRLDTFDARLQALESQAERRALETKPIWERALAEILEVKERLTAVEQVAHQAVRKIDVFGRDMLSLRADQGGIETRLDRLESRPTQ